MTSRFHFHTDQLEQDVPVYHFLFELSLSFRGTKTRMLYVVNTRDFSHIKEKRPVFTVNFKHKHELELDDLMITWPEIIQISHCSIWKQIYIPDDLQTDQQVKDFYFETFTVKQSVSLRLLPDWLAVLHHWLIDWLLVLLICGSTDQENLW